MTSNARNRPPWWLRLMNTTFIQLSRLGPSYGAEGPVVITVPGRKTGKPRSTPITPMTVNSSRYVIAGFPGADWVRNARAAGEATLQHGRHTERVRMVELSSEDARPVLRAFPTEVPTSVTFMKRFGLVKDAAPRSSRRLRDAPRCSASTLSKLSPKGHRGSSPTIHADRDTLVETVNTVWPTSPTALPAAL